MFAYVGTALGNENAARQFRTVALSGTPVPGIANATFAFLGGGGFDLNNAGQVGIRGFYRVPGASNGTGVWSEQNGALQLEAAYGHPALGSATFASPLSIRMDGSGNAAFHSLIGSNSNFNGSLWARRNGSLQPIAVEGSQAPDTPLGTTFNRDQFDQYGQDLFRGFAYNRQGKVAFYSRLKGTDVRTSNDTGVWADSDDSLSLVAREGDQAPGAPVGLNFFGFYPPVMNDPGDIAFIGTLETGTNRIDTDYYQGIWRGRAGAMELLARTGEHAPGTPANQKFVTFREGMSLNDAGQVAFVANLGPVGIIDINNYSGIWRIGNGPSELIARRGARAPGTPADVVFGGAPGFHPPSINGSGEIAFMASLEPNVGGVLRDDNDLGVWSNAGGTMQLVARTGDQATCLSDGVMFSYFDNMAFNSLGQTAFAARLSGENGLVNSGNDSGIWIQNRNGVSQLVIRKGDRLDVDNGPGVDLRTVNGVWFGSHFGNESGLSSGFNDNGQLAFLASFTDDSDGVFVWSPIAIPEASTFMTVLIAIGVLKIRWRPLRRL
jgi:hypothetical protein